MFGALQRILGRTEGKPHRFRPAEEFVRKPAPEPGGRAEAPAAMSSEPPRSAYSADVENRARKSGATVASILLEDREAAAAAFGKVLAFVQPREDCLEPREIERYAFWEAEPALFTPFPKERAAHLEGCVLCRSLAAAARPNSETAKRIARALARADELLPEWTTAAVEEPVLRRILDPARSAAAPSSRTLPARGGALAAAGIGMVLCVFGFQIINLWGGAAPASNAQTRYNNPNLEWEGAAPEAKGAIGRALDTDPHNSTLYQLQGNLHATQNKYGKAIADFDQALRADPGAAAAYKARAEAFGQTKQWEKALEDSNQYIKMKPDDPEGYWVRGQAYEQLGKISAARKDYETAVEAAKGDRFAKVQASKVEEAVRTVAPTSRAPEK